jgi:beta-phosphoglucomutase
MSMIDVAPEQCLIVEDNENGIKAATASGAHVLVVEDPGDVNLERVTTRIAAVEGSVVA